MKYIEFISNPKSFINKKSRLLAESILQNQYYIPINNTLDNDIFIAGFPKSGNTWMQNLISGLLFGIDSNLLPDKLTQELVPDVHTKKFYKRYNNITFFKTHELPKKHMKRVIHLVRDGRDAMVSYYAMNKAMGKKITLEEMIVSGKGIIPSKWYKHTRKWLANPHKADILIVKYEDLLIDPFLQLNRILEFSNIERDEEIINKTIIGNSFNEMKRKELEFGRDNKKWNPKNDFIRKGKIGSYKDEMPMDLIKIFESEAKKELEFFKYLM